LSVVQQAIGQRHLKRPAAAFLSGPRPRELDKDAPHEPGDHRKKVRAILPVDMLDIQQAQVRLVHHAVA
jgi:hypothetical protein